MEKIKKPKPQKSRESVTVNISNEEEQLQVDSKENAVQTILDQLQAANVEEKYCGLQTFSLLIENPENIDQILKKDVVKSIAPLLLDLANSVRNAAAGALRNLSTVKSEVCDAMMSQDVMTPLTMFFHEHAESWTSDPKSKSNEDDIDTVIQNVNLLLNLCESSELAMKYLGQSRILDILPRYLDIPTFGENIVIAVLQCLFVVVEDNPVAMSKIKVNAERQLQTLLALEGNEPSVMLIKTLAAGVIINTCGGNIAYLPGGTRHQIISILASTLAVDHRLVCNQLSSTLPLVDNAGKVETPKEKAAPALENQLKSVSLMLEAQQSSIEILANICSCEDGEDSKNGDSSDSKEVVDEDINDGVGKTLAEDKLPAEVMEALTSLEIFKKVWARTQLPAENVVLILKEYEGSKPIHKKLLNLQSAALLCMNNMLSTLPIHNLGGVNGVNKIWVEAGKFVIELCIHLCFLFSIFDVYFKSPIVNNVPSYEPKHEAVADRLALFVVDGLRAESFLNYTTMPYLRSLGNTHGRWGISHTRVPTESRPGHVAIIAGFYEDPSAVAKGWKENPVDFDSVFNQTTYTWYWGTYDIIDIFTKGSIDDHIISVKTYNPHDQEFTTDLNKTSFDAWVLNNVKDFFDNARSNEIVYKKLKKKKIAFFVHLLDTDIAGHIHKPKTQNFLTTIKFVDQCIKKIEQVIRNFYDDDGKTTFLMTSDHGMTDWGSHGSGDEHETQTPYVLWGAGVNQASQGQLDPETNGMSIEHRLDLEQADLAPLMSTILSIPVPVNSIGQLRSDLLNLSSANKAKAIYSNSRQLASQYDKKRSDIETNAITFLYQPFEPLTKEKLDALLGFTEDLLAKEDYEQLILLSEEIIDLSLSGLTYYHNYYQKLLLILVTLSFIGWIVCLLKVLSEQKVNTQVEASTANNYSADINTTHRQVVDYVFLVLFIVSTSIVNEQSLPVQYYLYFLMPVYLWRYAFLNLNLWTQIFRQLKKHKQVKTVSIAAFCYTMGSLALGLSFTYRWTLSIPLFGMGLWPFVSTTRRHLNRPVLLAWPLSCMLLSVFTFMPVVGKDVFIELVISAGVIWLFILTMYLWKILLPLYKNNEVKRREVVLTAVEMISLVVTLHNIFVQSRRFRLGTPVSKFYKALSWMTAASSFVLPLIHTRRLVCRLAAINTSLLNLYLLLSVSHEGLFVVTLIFNVICWIFIEFQLFHPENIKITEYSFDKETFGEISKIFTIKRSVSSQDFRRAFFYLTYLVVAFFGTGNISSLNSFEVRWVTCFIQSYRPFVITALVLLKTLTPFLIVACGFRAVQYMSKGPTGCLNVIVLIYSNIMGIQSLYYVKNTGSWLEIGTSISQFVIVQAITLGIVLINQLAKILTNVNNVLYNFVDKVFKL